MKDEDSCDARSEYVTVTVWVAGIVITVLVREIDVTVVADVSTPSMAGEIAN